MPTDFATLTRQLKEKYGTTPSTAGSGNNPSENPEATTQPDDFTALTKRLNEKYGTTPTADHTPTTVAKPTPTRWESPKTKAEKEAHITDGLMTLEQARSRGITEKEWLAMTSQAANRPELTTLEKMDVQSWRDRQSAPVTDPNAALRDYISRYNAFVESAQTDTPKLGYNTATAMVESRTQSAQELRREADRLTAWLETNRDRLPKETYQDLKEKLTKTRSGVDSIMAGFDDAARGYAQFETEEDYNAYAEEQKKYALDLDAASAEIADLEAKREAYAQTDYDWTDANARQQWRSGLDALDTEIARKKLYMESAKALQAERATMEGLLSGYDPETQAAEGQAGWESYLAWQQEQKEAAKQNHNRSFLEELMLMGALGPQSDTNLPVNLNSQALAQNARTAEEALAQPREDWTAQEKQTYGYLWANHREKCALYARMVNIAKNEEAEAAARQRVQSAATDNFLSGAVHTAGAILSSPAALADLLNNITHYSATGSLPQSDGVLSPWEYSEAVTSGIGSHLNEIGGTVAEGVPIIGGKGWGDVYGLSTSIAKSLLTAAVGGKIGGGTLAFITNLGPSAMSGIESAKSAGASDEKAIAYGLLTGLAEAAAEKVGVENLIGLKGKSILQNLLKQGVSEGLEEGLTSVANNFLDNLILQDKSQWQAAVNLYIRQGMTEAEAKKKAWTDMAEGIAYDTLGGFVSGMVSGGLETVADPKTHLAKKGLETSGDFLSKLTDPTTPEPPLPKGRWHGDSRDGGIPSPVTSAEPTTSPLTPGETSDLLDEAIARSTGAPEDPLGAALETLKSGGTVSNKQINHILQNAKAVSRLVEATGMKLPETASGKRAAVRTALQTLQESTATADNPTPESVGAVGGRPNTDESPVGSGYIPSETPDVILSDPEHSEGESKNPSTAVPAPIAQALETLRTGGTPTIAQTMAITADEAAISYLQQAIGADYPINPITIKAALSNLAKMTTPPIDTATEETAQKKAVSEETTVKVTSAGSAINDRNRESNTLAYMLASNLDSVRDMEPVAQLTGKELNDRSMKLSEQIRKFFASLGNKVFRNGFGAVELGEYGVGGILNHRPLNRAKAVSVAAVPNVIQNGRQINYDPNWKGRGYESFTFAAPITVNGTEVYVAAVVNRHEDNKFYLSEMVDSDGNYVRIEESPSGNSKNGLPMGPKNQQGRDYAGPEGLSGGDTPSTKTAEPTSPSNSSIPQATPNVNPEESVGAAPDGFDPYSHLQYEHGNQPDRPDDARDVNVPKKDTYGRRVSEFIANAYGAEVVPDSFIPVLEDMTVAGAFGVDTQSWQKALTDANNRIRDEGTYQATKSITEAVASGKIKDGDIATAMVLFAQYAHRTDTNSQNAATDLFADLGMMATMTGRNLQLFRLLRRLTPEGRLMAVKRSAEKVIDRIRKTRGEDVDGSKTTIEIPPELADTYKTATDARAAAEDALRAAEEALAEAERAARAAEDARNIKDDALAEAEAAHAAADAAIADRDAAIAEMEAAERAAEEARRRAEEARDREREAEHEIYRYAASRLDATFMEKWDAWRYMAMLGNAKTQIRNIAGNLLFRPLAEVKRYIGSVLELTLPKEQRTKAILGAGKEGRELRKWAKADAATADVRELLEYTATTGDSAARHAIDDYRTIFRTEWLEKARKGLTKMMEKEDMFFKKRTYVTSLASFIKARGYTSTDLTSGAVPTDVLNEGRAYAVKEALEATFNDQNAFSDFMCNFRYRGTNKVWRIISNVIGEGVLPFRRTPANIVVRAYEYSPATIPQLIYNGAYSVSHGKITASEFIDRISATLTGTAAIAMGYALASGILGCRLVGTEDDEDEKRQGHQSYSLEAFGKSIPLSWAAPAMIPLFVGANLYNLWNPDQSEENVSVTAFTDVLGALGNSFEPLLEMSCLSSLSDFLKSSAYTEDNAVLVTYLASAATSYMTQFFPTILGQVESALEPKKTETFANASDPFLRTVQRTLGNLSQRLPFGDLYQTEKIDQWGRPAEAEQDPWYERVWDSLVNPHNTKTLQDTEVDKEIQRLKGVQPENLSPTTPEKTISYTTTGGDKVQNHRLTAEEFAALEKAQGQTHFRLAQELIASEDYQALTDDQKAAVLLDIRSYAREYARGQVFSDYSYSAKWMGEVENGGAKAILNRQVSTSLSDGFTALTDAWKYGKGEETAQAAMDTAYETLSALTEDTRLELLPGLSKKVAAFVQAKDAGLETATFATLYRQYHSLDGTTTLTASQRAQKWAYTLDSAQEQGTISSRQNTILRDNLTFFQGFTADSGGYDKLVTATGSASTADYVFDLVKGLTPEAGKSSVTDRQKREAIVESDTLSQSDIEAVLPLYMGDTLATRYETALDKGFTSEVFVEAYGVYQDRSGKNAKDETIRTLVRDFGLGLARAKQLYEIFSKSP